MFLVATICIPLLGGGQLMQPPLMCTNRYIPMYGANYQECMLGAQQVIAPRLREDEMLKAWRCEE